MPRKRPVYEYFASMVRAGHQPAAVLATYMGSRGLSSDEIRFAFQFMQAQGQDPTVALFNACCAHEGVGINSSGKLVECEPYNYGAQFADGGDYEEGRSYEAEGVSESNEAQADIYDRRKAERTEQMRREMESMEQQMSGMDRDDMEAELDVATGNTVEIQS